MTTTETSGAELPLQQLENVVIRFAGDSGDGMQITGNQFTHTSALVGNDLATGIQLTANNQGARIQRTD